MRRRADMLHATRCGRSTGIPRIRLQEEDGRNVSGVVRSDAEVVAGLLQLSKGSHTASTPGLAGGHGVPLDTEAPEHGSDTKVSLRDGIPHRVTAVVHLLNRLVVLVQLTFASSAVLPHVARYLLDGTGRPVRLVQKRILLDQRVPQEEDARKAIASRTHTHLDSVNALQNRLVRGLGADVKLALQDSTALRIVIAGYHMRLRLQPASIRPAHKSQNLRGVLVHGTTRVEDLTVHIQATVWILRPALQHER